MNLEFQFSLEEEIRIIKQHFQNKTWLKKNNYKNILMPKNINFYSASEKEAIKTAKEEFENKEYEIIKNQIKTDFKKHENEINKSIKKFFKNTKKKIIIILSKYGLGAFYLPNKIQLNFKKYAQKELVWVIFHELIHLHLELYVKKYQLIHWETERVVDLILHNNKNLNLNFWQKNYFGVEKYIDSLFTQFFENNKQTFFNKIKELKSNN